MFLLEISKLKDWGVLLSFLLLQPLLFQLVAGREDSLPNCVVDDFVEMVKAVSGNGVVG